MEYIYALLYVIAFGSQAFGDMYLHNPRGSNNRLDEDSRNRNNANRMFDSQNNDRGGYNVGSLYYYSGSILSIEWTNQHSCGDPNNHCEVIFQYMCDDQLRDGASRGTIPDNFANCENYDCNNDIEHGMNENYEYYITCRLRERNKGLFTASQNLRGETSIYTRQNPNGNRRGYECPEERDYYPYWHPTPWIDIAVLTSDASRCDYYRSESQNVKSRYQCLIPNEDFRKNLNTRRKAIPNNQEECESEEFNGKWLEFSPPEGLAPPECVETLWSRDNHLGNGMGGFPNTYNWTIPADLEHEHCVLRARYNISTADYQAWDGAVSSDNNTRPSRNVANLDVYSQFDLTAEEAIERDYVFENNPQVDIFDTIDDVDVGEKLSLQLAINTAQFGRTFQDRSHSFAVRKRPSDIPEEATIYNLNVRGKRGNIVQVYPGVEYDFVPNRLIASRDAYVHIQWTGSNTNPRNNDGQGLAGTDRSNVVLLRDSNYAEGTAGSAVPVDEKFGQWGNSYPALLTGKPFLGLNRVDRQALATLDNMQLGGEMSELDDAGTYFDLGARKVTQPGTYYYMSTRNNNFSNRSQKGKIVVLSQAIAQARIGATGGSVSLNGHYVEVPQGTLTSATQITLVHYGTDEGVSDLNLNVDMTQVISDGVVVVDNQNADIEGQPMRVAIKLSSSAFASTASALHATGPGEEFQTVPSTYSNGFIIAETTEGGIFVVTSPGATILIGVLVPLFLILIILLVVVIAYCIYRRKTVEKKYSICVQCTNRFKRSFQKEI